MLQRNWLHPRDGWPFWVLSGVFFSLFATWFFAREAGLPPGQWYIETGDTPSYLDSIDQWLSTGNYGGIGYAEGRLPGYGLFYGLLRMFLAAQDARNALVGLQALFTGLTPFFAGYVAYSLSKQKQAFYLAFVFKLGLLNLYLYNFRLITESIGFFLLLAVPAAFLHWQASKGTARMLLLATALCLLWLVKPVFLPVTVLVALAVLWTYRFQLRQAWVPLLWLALPSVLVLSAWMVRNHARDGRWYLLQSSEMYNRVPPKADAEPHFGRYCIARGDAPVTRLLQAWGYDRTWFRDHNPALEWLLAQHRKDLTFAQKQALNEPHPFARVLDDQITLDSLKALRRELIAGIDTTLPLIARNVWREKAENRARRYLQHWQTNRVWDNQVTSRLHLLKDFLLSGPDRLKLFLWEAKGLPLPFALLRTASHLWFNFVLGWGLLGLFWAFYRHPEPGMALLGGLLVWIVVAYPLLTRHIEPRYADALYPLLSVTAALGLSVLVSRFYQTKSAT